MHAVMSHSVYTHTAAMCHWAWFSVKFLSVILMKLQLTQPDKKGHVTAHIVVRLCSHYVQKPTCHKENECSTKVLYSLMSISFYAAVPT